MPGSETNRALAWVHWRCVTLAGGDDFRPPADAPASPDNARFLEGANNWKGIMAALDEVGYQGIWGIAEQGGGSSQEGLNDLSARMDRIFAS
jgi:sugar phosphate isomerase/epimerase